MQSKSGRTVATVAFSAGLVAAVTFSADMPMVGFLLHLVSLGI